MPASEQPSSTPYKTPLWQLAFRPGFLAAALSAVLAMSAWLVLLEGNLNWDYHFNPAWWHAHEMLFGFAMPVVVGFLLTAVATWTGVAGTSGSRLKCLFACWLAGRVALLLPGSHAIPIAATADSLFMLGATWELGRRVWAVRQSRNYAFVPILLLFTSLNLMSYSRADAPLASSDIHYGVLWLFLLLIAFVGGRVIPFFTARRLGFEQPATVPWLDYGAIALLLVIVLLSVSGQLWRDQAWLRALLLVTATMHLLRLVRWRGWRGLGEPLLWSLHLSYLFIPTGLLGLALVIPDPLASKQIMHLLGIGALTGMILAMIARVALGHTGRPLRVGVSVSASFVLLAIAALLRSMVPLLWPELTMWAWRLSALCWIAAFTTYLWHYLPILLTARPDGKPG
jgi:uncharacterized protein involved in response to NO